MVGSSKSSKKKDIYCEHTCPRYFHAFHYEDSTETKEETEVEAFGRKVTSRFALFVLGFVGDTIWLVLSILNPIVRLFGGNLIATEKDVIINDYRCELCKKEAPRC